MLHCHVPAISTWRPAMNSRLPHGASGTSSSEAAARARNSRWPRIAADVAQPIAALIIFVLWWELVCRAFNVPAYLVPAPSGIWTDTWMLMGQVSMHPMASTQTTLLGFCAWLVVSLPFAILLTASPTVANTVYPFLVLTQSMPKPARAPSLDVIFGSNELPW